MIGSSLAYGLHILTVVAGIGFLIFIHELGHFLVAKRMGVRVDKFSLGFGPTITGFRWHGTEYVLSWIPLGGYVKMAGENAGDPRAGAPDEFTSKPVWRRALIAVAGITMNGLTAVVAFVLAFQLGVEALSPIVGRTEAGWPAWEAGVREGDTLVAIGDTPIRSFEDLLQEVALWKGPEVPLTVDRRHPDGSLARLDLRVGRRLDESWGIPKIGIRPALSTRIERVGTLSPAVPSPGAELRPGDTVLAVEGEDISSWRDLEHRLVRRGHQPTTLEIQRGKERLSFTVTPQPLWTIGVEPRTRIVVRGVADGQPAAAAGFRADDQILSVDGLPIETMEAFQRAIQAGERHPLAVAVQRQDGSATTLQVEPEEDAAEGKRMLGIHFSQEAGHAVLADPALGQSAQAAGVRGGDVLVGIDLSPPPHPGPGTIPVSRWADVERALAGVTDPARMTLRIQRRAETLDAKLEIHPGDTAESLGLSPALVVGAVQTGSPAAALGIVPGDRLRYLRLDDPPASDASLGATQGDWTGMTSLMQLAGQLGGENRLRLDWVHDAPGLAGPVEHLQDAVGLIPAESVLAYGMSSLDLLGIYPEPARVTLRLDSLGASLGAGLRRTRDETQNIFRTVRSFFAPKGEAISTKNLGGFITIFMGADHSLEAGPGTFVLFLGIISINLAVLNLLPIPVLDGGLLLLLAIEKLRGSPLSDRTQAWFQYAGLALLLPLVLFVTYNDIAHRLVPLFR